MSWTLMPRMLQWGDYFFSVQNGSLRPIAGRISAVRHADHTQERGKSMIMLMPCLDFRTPLYYCESYRGGAEVDSLPCGGCPYCTRAQAQCGRFEENVDDIVPLAAVSLETLRVSVCADDGDNNWANISSYEYQRTT